MADFLDPSFGVLSLCLPRLGSFFPSSITKPVEIVHAMHHRGFEAATASHERWPTQQFYHWGMAKSWAMQPPTYQAMNICVDFNKRGLSKIVQTSPCKQVKVRNVHFSFRQFDDMLYEDGEPSIDPDALESFRHFDHIIYGQQQDIQAVLGEDEPVNAGHRLSWGFAAYMRKAVRKEVCNHPQKPAVLVSVFRDNQECVMTSAQSAAKGFDHADYVPLTNPMSSPAALLNNLQMSSIFKKERPRFTETELGQAADYINHFADKAYVQSGKCKNPFDRALKYL